MKTLIYHLWKLCFSFIQSMHLECMVPHFSFSPGNGIGHSGLSRTNIQIPFLLVGNSKAGPHLEGEQFQQLGEGFYFSGMSQCLKPRTLNLFREWCKAQGQSKVICCADSSQEPKACWAGPFRAGAVGTALSRLFLRWSCLVFSSILSTFLNTFLNISSNAMNWLIPFWYIPFSLNIASVTLAFLVMKHHITYNQKSKLFFFSTQVQSCLQDQILFIFVS